MKLQNITEEVFTSFTKTHELGTFLQTVEEKHLKEIYNIKCHLVGLFQDNEIIGASMLIEIPTKIHKPIFYAPRGFITDYSNSEYVEGFTKEILSYIKKYHALEFIMDPYIIYQIRNNNGSEVEEKNDAMISYLKSLGYQHFGFNLNFEASQVRFMYRIPVFQTYEETISKFTKSTRKRIEETHEKGVHVRIAKKEELPIVVDLLKASAENKHFEYRSVQYYENLLDSMKNLLTIYIASIDFEEEKRKTKAFLKETEEDLSKLHEEMKKVNVGAKLLKKQEILEQRIKKCEEELKHIEEMKKTYGTKKDIGALVSIRSNQEYITLSSGMLTEFRAYNPKYAMYEAHIKDAIEEKFSYVNFYGISGNFDPKSELYGIYDLKRGFNGNVIELIGEFSYPVSILCTPYHILLKIREKLKK